MPLYSLGSLAEAQRQLSEAIALFEASIALDPAFEPGLFSLAAMYANAGRLDDALATLDRPQAQDALAMRAQIGARMARARH